MLRRLFHLRRLVEETEVRNIDSFKINRGLYKIQQHTVNCHYNDPRYSTLLLWPIFRDIRSFPCKTDTWHIRPYDYRTGKRFAKRVLLFPVIVIRSEKEKGHRCDEG